MGYETEAWREPSLKPGYTRVFSEHGRILGNTCYRSHWMALDKGEHGGYFLTVKHGGGEEHFQIAYSKRLVDALAALDSDARYFILHQFLRIKQDAERAAQDKTANDYKRAFAEGRLRKRKLRGQDAVKVWVDRPIVQAAARV